MKSAALFRGLRSAISLPALLLLLFEPLAAQTAAPNSPVGNHLVGTVLGEPETLGLHDFRTDADFVSVTDFAFLPNGDMLIADRGQHRVLRVGADGIVRPFAGTGEAANSGDGGPALEASIFAPEKLAVDGAGNVFISHGIPGEQFGGVRKISTEGGIETAVGGGSHASSDDSAPFCADTGVPATTLQLQAVEAITAAENGDLFLKVFSCGTIYRLAKDETTLSAYAGITLGGGSNWNVPLGSLKIALPLSQLRIGRVAAMVPDGAGGLVVADSENGFVFRVTPENVAILMAGIKGLGKREGAALEVPMVGLNGLAMLPGGDVAVSRSTSSASSEIGVITPEGEYSILTTGDAFNGKPIPSYSGKALWITGVRATPGGKLFTRDFPTGSILEWSAPGTFTLFAGRFRQGSTVTPSDTAPLLRTSDVSNVVAGGNGNLYFVSGQRLYRLSPAGALEHIAGNGQVGAIADGQPPLTSVLSFGGTLAIDEAGNLYWGTFDRSIRKFTTAAALDAVAGGGTDVDLTEDKAADSIRLSSLEAWTVSPAGEVFFEEKPGGGRSARIWRVTTDGKLARRIGTDIPGQPSSPEGKAPGDVFVSDFGSITASATGALFFTASAIPSSIWVSDGATVTAMSTSTDPQAIPEDGEPSASAPTGPWNNFRALSSSTLLISAGVQRALAAYARGGVVTLWRAANEGDARSDGARLRDDLFFDSTPVTMLPDGGLAWTERGQTFPTIRRTFPVPAGCTYSLPGAELAVGGGNVLTQVNLSTGADCPWTVGSSSNWIEVLSKRTGKGPTTIEIRALANPSPVARTGHLMIAGERITVSQAPSTRNDIFVVSPASASLPASGGSVEVTISASPTLPWQVALPSVPVTITGPSAGTGSATFTVTLPALPAGTTELTAILFVNDRTVTLRQVAASMPVPVTISSTRAGQTARVDLVDRALPYVAQWAPGSVHWVEAPDTSRVNTNTLVQFQGWNDDPAQFATRLVVAPPSASILTAQYRALHMVRARSQLATAPLTIQPVFDRQGVTVPAPFAPGSGTAGERALWFPEGSSVSIFAPEEANARFSTFSGSVNSASNPTTVNVNGPVDVTATYTPQAGLVPAYQIGGAGRWWFAGDVREANAGQLSVIPLVQEALPQPSIFVSYANSADDPRWLTVRKSNPTAPFSLELAVDPATPADAPLGDASIYVHQPGYQTVKATATATVSAVPTNNTPWIGAVTDGGGFRQSVSDTGADAPLVVAPGMILTAFGLNFGTTTQSAPSVPLPTSLGGVSVEYQIFASDPWASSPLFFVSPGQINFQVSPSASAGFAAGLPIRFRVRTGPGTVSEPWEARLRPRSISLFSADSSGGGAAAGFFVRVLPDQTQERGSLFACTSGTCTVSAVAFGAPENQLFLELFGTGFRNAGTGETVAVYIGGVKAEVAFVGPHAVFVGLDQLNVKVPPEVPRGVDLDLYVWVRNGENPWMVSNRLTVRFQ